MGLCNMLSEVSVGGFPGWLIFVWGWYNMFLGFVGIGDLFALGFV